MAARTTIMNTLLSPSLAHESQGSDHRPSPSTPTLTRAKNTSRRIKVWMLQTWRERAIPSADFQSNTSGKSQLKRGRFALVEDSSVVTPSKGISPSIESLGGKRYSTPPTSSNTLLESRQNMPAIIYPEQVLVANVDEALGAWTSLHKLEQHSPEYKGEEVGKEIDWILDGRDEWQEQYERSRELLRTMYPKNSGNILSDLLMTRNNNNILDKKAQESNSTDFETSIDTNDVSGARTGMDDESLLLLKFGGTIGQQEYQFASFETADFSTVHPDPKAALDDSIGDKDGSNSIASDGIYSIEQEHQLISMETANVSRISSSKKETEQMKDPARGLDVDEWTDRNQKEFKEDDDDGMPDRQFHDELKAECELKEDYSPKRREDFANKTLNPEGIQQDSEVENQTPHTGVNVSTDMHRKCEMMACRKMLQNGTRQSDALATIEDDEANLANSNLSVAYATTTVTTFDNFEDFWQNAVDAPTPETGTFPSIGSRSTYATSPLTSSVDDRVLSPPSPFLTRNNEVLECIHSWEEGETDGDDAKYIDDVIERIASHNGVEDDEGGPCSQDYSMQLIKKKSGLGDVSEGEKDEGIDSSGAWNEPTVRNNSSSESQRNARSDQLFEDHQKYTLNHLNTTFDTIVSPLPKAITAAENLISSPTFYTGITPLQKNARCLTPVRPLQTSTASSYTPVSQRFFVGQKNDTKDQPKDAESPSSTRALQAAETTAATEPFTPVTRNFRYLEPEEDDSIESTVSNPYPFDGRTIMAVSGKTITTESPGWRFEVDGMNSVMICIPDEDSDLVQNFIGNEQNSIVDGSNVRSDVDESFTEGREGSLVEESTQSNSIPSVVQLFTKPVDSQRRKIAVPNTVRAKARLSLPSNYNSSTTNVELTMPSFYVGRNKSSIPKKYHSFPEIYSVSTSEVASALASIMSMPMMTGMRRQGSVKVGSEQIDELSINSSINSPEVKFIRRNKNTMSKRLLRSQKGSIISSMSTHSRISRTTEDGNDDGAFDELRPYSDPHCDFHHFYGIEEDLEDSDCGVGEFTDEESLSLGSLSTLPYVYWKHPELDHTLRELTKLEWVWLPYWQMERLLDDSHEYDVSTKNVPLFQDQITNKLSKLDSLYRKICKRVYRKIQPHSKALLSANQAALDLQQNLQLCQMYLSRSQKSIELAKHGRILSKDWDGTEGEEGVGVQGALRLLEIWDIQHKYLALGRVEEAISEICDLESAVSERILCFDTYKQNCFEGFEKIMNMVTILKAKLFVDPAKRLFCFDAARQRVHCWISEVFMSRLHVCLSDLTVEWCHASESSYSTLHVVNGVAYSRLIEILLRVGYIHAVSSDSLELESESSSNPTKRICTTIQTSLLLEIHKGFGRALLDPTYFEIDEKSEYEQELAALNNETYLHGSRLPVWTHNLVTIRFEFEMKEGGKHPLPAIFHKLCLLLTNVLRGMLRLIEWHNEVDPSRISPKDVNDNAMNFSGISRKTKIEIHEELKARRASIWNACIQSIEECFQEYLKHSGKIKLFSKIGDQHDDSNWWEDLEGLHEVSVLSRQFLSIRRFFLDGISDEVINDGSRIEELLYSCFKAHLRTLHVEAMNTLGAMLYREDWRLYSFQELQGTATSSERDGNDESVRSIIESISQRLQYAVGSKKKNCFRSRYNAFTKTEPLNLYDRSLLVEGRNPFEIDRNRMKVESVSHALIRPISSWDNFCSNRRIEPILELLHTYISGSDYGGTTSKMFVKSVFKGFLPWTARLLITVDKLPVLAEAACNVLQNIVDLYVTTAFRLCAGNECNERVLLGIDTNQDTNAKRGNAVADRSASPPMFEFGLRSKVPQAHSNKPSPVISSTAEAELCALVIEESDGLEFLQNFLIASQKRLDGVAKLNLVDDWVRDPTIGDNTTEEEFAEATASVLEKRQAASCNHIFVILGLFLAIQCVPSSSSRVMIHNYTDQALEVLPLMLTLSNRISCMRSIRGRALLRELISVGNGWEESKLHEQANDYVEDFCNFLALLWHSLSAPASGRRLPHGILKSIWENLLGGGYMVLLDGFSKVPYCSTEGRALMSMDVASYRSGTRPCSITQRLKNYSCSTCACPFPKYICPYRTTEYVDTYIKIFYFPSNDAIEWIKAHYQRYHRQHILSLVINDRDAKKLTEEVMKYYYANGSAKTIRV